MNEEITAILISQNGDPLDLKSYWVEAQNEELVANAYNEHGSTITTGSKSIPENREQPNTTDDSNRTIQRLIPAIQFFEGMPSFEQVTLVVTHPGDFRHILTMSAQTAVMRLLPFFIDGKISKLIELPGIDLSMDTHPFLKSGWIQQELHSIITEELVQNNRSHPMEHVIEEITERFQKNLELLHRLHNYVTSYGGQCTSLSNGLATAIMCVDFILLNPRDVVEQMCRHDSEDKRVNSDQDGAPGIGRFRVL